MLLLIDLYCYKIKAEMQPTDYDLISAKICQAIVLLFDSQLSCLPQNTIWLKVLGE